MVDAAVRPKTTRPHTDNADANLRIDVARVTDLLMGTWADTRREAREMIKDSAFWRKDEPVSYTHLTLPTIYSV